MASLPYSRRRFLSALAAGASLPWPEALRAAEAASGGVCTLSAQQVLGPYYLDTQLVRRDVTEGKPGAALQLDLTVLDASRCTPLSGALVEIWQCDALGSYSGFTSPSAMPPPPGGMGQRPPPPFGAHGEPPPPPPPTTTTDALRFLRGIQYTDAHGVATFQTIVPGVYAGRTNHVHFRVRTGIDRQDGHGGRGGHVAHTGQVFFPEPLMVRLTQSPPYRDNPTPRTTQSGDGIFLGEHGAQSVARIAGDETHGLRASLTVAVSA